MNLSKRKILLLLTLSSRQYLTQLKRLRPMSFVSSMARREVVSGLFTNFLYFFYFFFALGSLMLIQISI